MTLSTSMSPANRTGIKSSPIDSKAQLAVPASLREPRLVAATDATALRGEYIVDADALGSIPPPGTVKGIAKAGLQALKGNRAQVLLDKIAERLAFERAGTRLYDQIITKCEVLADASDDATDAAPMIEGLRQIRLDEISHAQLLVEAMEQLGGDPTAQTPSADLVGTEGMGLLQALSDPRTTPMQCLHALLTAELTDNAGWELLIDLARHYGQDDLAQQFAGALAQEEAHLARVKAWHTAAVLGETSVLASVADALSDGNGADGAMVGNGPARGVKAAPVERGATAKSPEREPRGVAVKKVAGNATKATPARHPKRKDH